MGEIRDCPGQNCENSFEYPDGPDECPRCGYDIKTWWENRRKGIASFLDVPEDEVK